MATMHMVELMKRVRSVVLAILLSISLLPGAVFAVNYGAGSYNTGLYSASSPESESTTQSTEGTVTGSVAPVLILTKGCTKTTLYSPQTGVRCPIVITNTPTTPSVSSPVGTTMFTMTLSVGKKHTEVLRLQQYLNTHGFPVALSGPGSKGKETNYFGRATKAALIKFQNANKILPATGAFGPKTKALINSKL